MLIYCSPGEGPILVHFLRQAYQPLRITLLRTLGSRTLPRLPSGIDATEEPEQGEITAEFSDFLVGLEDAMVEGEEAIGKSVAPPSERSDENKEYFKKNLEQLNQEEVASMKDHIKDMMNTLDGGNLSNHEQQIIKKLSQDASSALNQLDSE